MNARAFLKTAMALGLAGCGPSPASVCNKLCDCVGCSDPELTDCIDNAEDAQKAAGDEGCSDQYNAYLSCSDAEFACVDGKVDDDGCGSELKAYATCML